MTAAGIILLIERVPRKTSRAFAAPRKEGEGVNSWPNASERRATAREAVRKALDEFQHQLDNARDVAQKSGLA